jgi:AcrR family transcriptional regulator
MGRPAMFSDEELLAVAKAVFLRDGVNAPVKDIAARVAISEAAIFKRYPAKADLVAAAMVVPPPDIAALLAPLDGTPDPRSALAQLLRNLIGYLRAALPIALARRGHARRPDAAETTASIEPAIAAITGALGQRIAVMARRGRFATVDPVAAAGLVVTTASSLALFEVLGFHAGTTPAPLLDSLTGALWGSLGTQAAGIRNK